MLRSIISLALLLPAVPALAQAAADAPLVWSFDGAGDKHVEESAEQKVVVEKDIWGKSRLMVLAPEGGTVTVLIKGKVLFTDEVPTVFDPLPSIRYTVKVEHGSAPAWTHDVIVKKASVAKLWVGGAKPAAQPAEAAPAPAAAVAAVPAQPPRCPTVAAAPAQPASGPVPAPEPAIGGMSSEQVTRLETQIRAETSPMQKRALVEEAMARGRLSTQQLAQLLPLFQFPRERIDVIRAARPHLLDPQNGAVLATRFDYASERLEVQSLFP